MNQLSNTSKKILDFILVLGLCSTLISPGIVQALSNDSSGSTTADTNSGSKTSPFCTNITSETSNITSKVQSLVSKAGETWSNQSLKWISEEQKVDQQVAASREKADAQRQEDYSALLAKAKTTAQTVAARTYETSVSNAVIGRRGAYDQARQTFWNSVQSAISTRANTVNTQLNTFQSSVNSAIQTAQTSCSSNPDNGSSIRVTLQASLKDARVSFQSQRAGDTAVISQVKQFAATRDKAFKTADTTFQNLMSATKAALLKAFGSNSSSVN